MGLLAGCGEPGAEAPWVAYHQQLVKDLQGPPLERHTPSNIGAFPERKARLFNITETRESLPNVYALRECHITSLIAARNNQLGRMAPPSQHWLYERELWQRLSGCWNTAVPDNLNEEDRSRLHRLTLRKTQQLPLVSWNTLFDSSEWEGNFSRASHAIDPEDLMVISAHLEAVTYLHRMILHQFNRQWEQDSSTLEGHLQTLQQRPLSAEIMRALLLATQRLEEGTDYLKQYGNAQTMCLTPWKDNGLDNLAEHSREWLEAVNALFTVHPVMPPKALRDYRQRWLSLNSESAPWSAFQLARKQHQETRAHFTGCQSRGNK
ncbi:DUF3080 domain-containing protein [Halomonas sediminis]